LPHRRRFIDLQRCGGQQVIEQVAQS
jgi:hypothetical protein